MKDNNYAYKDITERIYYIFFSLWFYSPLDLGYFFSFLILYTVGRTPWTGGDWPVARPLPTHRTTQTQNKRTQTSMAPVGSEPMTTASERAKTVHALDCAATVISNLLHTCNNSLKSALAATSLSFIYSLNSRSHF
jgi:hypothetical protein